MNSLVDRSGWHLRSARGLHVGYLQADTEFARCALASAAERTELLKDWVAPDLLVLDDLFLATRVRQFEPRNPTPLQ